MGACTCGGRVIGEKIFSNYFQSLKIRHISPLIFNEKLVEIYQYHKVCDQDVFLNKVIEEFFISKSKEDYRQITINLFHNLMLHYKQDLVYILISFIFLCSSEKISAKISFKKLIHFFIPIHVIPSKKDEKKCLLERESLVKILECYLNIISSFSIKYVSNLSTNEENFTKEFTELYKSEKIKCLVNSIVDKYSYNVDIEEFFQNEYLTLSNDNLLREMIGDYKIPLQKRKSSFFAVLDFSSPSAAIQALKD
jgi:hypothetical protein